MARKLYIEERKAVHSSHREALTTGYQQDTIAILRKTLLIDFENKSEYLCRAFVRILEGGGCIGLKGPPTVVGLRRRSSSQSLMEAMLPPVPADREENTTSLAKVDPSELLKLPGLFRSGVTCRAKNLTLWLLLLFV